MLCVICLGSAGSCGREFSLTCYVLSSIFVIGIDFYRYGQWLELLWNKSEAVNVYGELIMDSWHSANLNFIPCPFAVIRLSWKLMSFQAKELPHSHDWEKYWRNQRSGWFQWNQHGKFLRHYQALLSLNIVPNLMHVACGRWTSTSSSNRPIIDLSPGIGVLMLWFECPLFCSFISFFA